MANLTIAPPNPGTNLGSLTQGVLIYLVPFDTVRTIGLVEQYQQGTTPGVLYLDNGRAKSSLNGAVPVGARVLAKQVGS